MSNEQPELPTQSAPSQVATPAKQPTTIRGWLSSPEFQDQVAKALPKHLTPERQIRIALTALTRTPKLADCTPASVLKCILDLSAMGLEPDGRRAHLIPYGRECTLILDYKGLAELAMRSGMISNIHADVVCDKDHFEADTGKITHKVNYREPRGDVYAAYCLIRFKDGGEKAEVMTRDEVEAIRKRSRAGNNGPWVSDWNEMAKKTAARRAFKWVPLSPEIRDAVEKDDDALEVQASPVARAEPLNPFMLPEEGQS
jgi:recombination protein RecT